MHRASRRQQIRKLFKTYGFACIGYALFVSAGLLAFRDPSPVMRDQAGRLVLFSWGAVCFVGGVLSLVGLLRKRRVLRLLGAALCTAASLVWCVALILHAIATHSSIPLTAACMAGALAALLAQRWADVSRPPYE